MLAQLAFQRVGIPHPLQAVTNGQKAIDYLAGNGIYADRQKYPFPCLVLLDLNLPITSGMEFLRWMRAQAQYKTLPVLVYTSSANEGDRTKARELGANEYYVKSIHLAETDELFACIRQSWLNST